MAKFLEKQDELNNNYIHTNYQNFILQICSLAKSFSHQTDLRL